MNNYICLQKNGNHYYPIDDSIFKDLRYFVDFLAGDYRQYDQSLFLNSVTCYNASFVYHNLEQKIFYIGFSEWEIFEEIDIPDDQDFPNYVNETNNCKISVDNFKEFTNTWLTIKESTHFLAIIYRDDNNWIHCQSFNSTEEMGFFVKSLQ
ncbi:hypothetical protein KBC04_02640 [Candidatus Babeliales bacterium]|nr:hypothetical protein [Candidatus Babeliales bacterium]MBP9844050.1 hypothetical protein [Candidatus Babeliales bacterium]